MQTFLLITVGSVAALVVIFVLMEVYLQHLNNKPWDWK